MIQTKNLRIFVHSILKLSKYRLWGKRVKPKVVYIIDGSNYAGGLTDRLRQVMGVYSICKNRGYEFGLIFNHPFELTNYLLPNYNWSTEDGDISRNIFYAKPVYLGFRTKKKYLSLINLKKKQLHLYASVHWGFVLDLGYKMDQIFWELFKPVPLITKLVNEFKSKYNSWDCLVFRFQDLLNDFNEAHSAQYLGITLSRIEKENLIYVCLNYIASKTKDLGKYILVCSDSVTFLKRAEKIPGVFIIPGELSHMEYSNDKSFDLHLKSFLDFFMISESNCIESVGTNFMYPTDFPVLAACIKNRPFKRTLLNLSDTQI